MPPKSPEQETQGDGWVDTRGPWERTEQPPGPLGVSLKLRSPAGATAGGQGGCPWDPEQARPQHAQLGSPPAPKQTGASLLASLRAPRCVCSWLLSIQWLALNSAGINTYKLLETTQAGAPQGVDTGVLLLQQGTQTDCLEAWALPSVRRAPGLQLQPQRAPELRPKQKPCSRTPGQQLNQAWAQAL